MKTQNTKTPGAIGRNLDQNGDANLASNGQDNNSRITTKTTKYSGNQHGGPAGGNYGRGPTVGNKGNTVEGPAKPPTDSLPNFQSYMKKSDSLNFGPGPRTPGGTRSFDPKAGQNYKGNADQINMGRGPTKGNAQ
jgi:hypothetical protein